MKFSKNHLTNIGASLESQLCDLKKKQFVERSKLVASHLDELEQLDHAHYRQKEKVYIRLHRVKSEQRKLNISITPPKISKEIMFKNVSKRHIKSRYQSFEKEYLKSVQPKHAERRILPFRQVNKTNAYASTRNRSSAMTNDSVLISSQPSNEKERPKYSSFECAFSFIGDKLDKRWLDNSILPKTSSASSSCLPVVGRSSKLNSPFVSPIISATVSPLNSQINVSSESKKSSSSSLPSLKFDIVDAFIERNKNNVFCKNTNLDAYSPCWSPCTDILISPNSSYSDLSYDSCDLPDSSEDIPLPTDAATLTQPKDLIDK
jgi:hypothetical protein